MPKLSEPEKRDAPTLAKLVFDLLRRQRPLHKRYSLPRAGSVVIAQQLRAEVSRENLFYRFTKNGR